MVVDYCLSCIQSCNKKHDGVHQESIRICGECNLQEMFSTMITKNGGSGAGMYDTDHQKQGGWRRNVQYIFTKNWPLG
jgi:hypothetical protein